MRQVFTRHAQEHGLNVVATRRQDREQLRADILAGQAPLRENTKLNPKMKQTRQGRTFDMKAPSWYAEHGLDYERRRLAAASVDRGKKGPAPGPTVGQGSPEAQTAPRPRGLLGRLFGRAVGKGSEQDPLSSGQETPPAAAPKRGGYYQNFDNYRNGTG
ncbi:MAG: hypothetical protein JWL84_3897, partial [Rhodospirillales bacterium]|nr:hypothetical protein [Rhodospirillales bacterium]